MRRQVKHHFIDILEPKDDYSAAQFSQEAKDIIQKILGRKKKILVVGGSGLYIRALIDGIFVGPDADWDIRSKLINENGFCLYEKLKELDPAAAGKIHPSDTRRIIRALEVYEITNSPISELQGEISIKFH